MRECVYVCVCVGVCVFVCLGVCLCNAPLGEHKTTAKAESLCSSASSRSTNINYEFMIRYLLAIKTSWRQLTKQTK